MSKSLLALLLCKVCDLRSNNIYYFESLISSIAPGIVVLFGWRIVVLFD